MFSILRSSLTPVLKSCGAVTCKMNFQAHEVTCKRGTFLGSSSNLFRRWTWICHYSDSKFNQDGPLDDELHEIVNDEEYEQLASRIFRSPDQPHNVFVVQPCYKNAELGNLNTTPELQLEESVALINSLPGWKVLGTEIVSLLNFKKREFFGFGTLDRLKQILNQDKKISAIFVSVNIFRVRQLIELETYLGVPCYDRYTIVVQIFRNHAVTKEAKLQVSMAEIPYLRQCVKGLPKGFSDRLGSGDIVGGPGLTLVETRRAMLAEREKKIKTALKKLKNHREQLRLARNKVGFPIIAVVGYTNAGKTSLIKILTGEEKMQPRNQLFATLDVTKHAGTLPCNLEVLYVDTVGFISNIPNSLIESFTATLEDAIHSDMIIHVWDVSHPDSENQRNHVWDTLRKLNLSEELLRKVIEVGNKADKLSESKLSRLLKREPNMLFVSAKTGFHIGELLSIVEKGVLKATNRFRIVMRVKTGGEEYDWLREVVAVENFSVDPNNSQYCLMRVLITEGQLEMFKHRFI